MPESHDAPPILRRLFALEGHVATVVGGAGRIGSSLCHALAEAGAKVCILDSDPQRGAQLRTQLIDSGHRHVLLQTIDATDPAALEAAVVAIESQLGPPSILVNAAQFRGTGFYSSSVDDYPLQAWNQVVAVNLTGVYLACQAFGRAMSRHGGGRIVNLASTYGVVSPDPRIYGDSGVNSPVSYAASKAGVIHLTRYLAVHWRERNIRANCLVPGGVFDQQGDEFVANYCQRTPLGRMATADDYQGAVLFMVSDASRYMTGSVVTVDGGWTAW
jgi:NAD(P)-dependent dehydrogenase (short-subunit alcohol dehydrogenase family)